MRPSKLSSRPSVEVRMRASLHVGYVAFAAAVVGVPEYGGLAEPPIVCGRLKYHLVVIF